MPYKTNQKALPKSRKKWLFLVLALVLIASGLYWWHKDHQSNAQAANKASSSTGASSTSSSNSSPKSPSTDSNRVIGGGSDTGGQASTSTNSSQWATSASGNITLQQPIANAILQTRATLSGTAKVSQVNFRLIDNSVGVISEGSLSVVNGKFSGTLNFTARASAGQLDVFSTNSTGVEINEIQIAVKF